MLVSRFFRAGPASNPARPGQDPARTRPDQAHKSVAEWIPEWGSTTLHTKEFASFFYYYNGGPGRWRNPARTLPKDTVTASQRINGDLNCILEVFGFYFLYFLRETLKYLNIIVNFNISFLVLYIFYIFISFPLFYFLFISICCLLLQKTSTRGVEMSLTLKLPPRHRPAFARTFHCQGHDSWPSVLVQNFYRPWNTRATRKLFW